MQNAQALLLISDTLAENLRKALGNESYAEFREMCGDAPGTFSVTDANKALKIIPHTYAPAFQFDLKDYLQTLGEILKHCGKKHYSICKVEKAGCEENEDEHIVSALAAFCICYFVSQMTDVAFVSKLKVLKDPIRAFRCNGNINN